MDILLMDTIQQEVLALFREEIPGYLDSNWKEIPLELDSDLFEARAMTCMKLWINLKKI